MSILDKYYLIKLNLLIFTDAFKIVEYIVKIFLINKSTVYIHNNIVQKFTLELLDIVRFNYIDIINEYNTSQKTQSYYCESSTPVHCVSQKHIKESSS